MRTIPIFDATAPGVVIGRHSLWSPEIGLKVPFSFGGLLTKYGHDEAGHDPADTIPHELAILRALASHKMAPPIGDVVRIETLVSTHRGAWHADPMGAWGYQMMNAHDLPPGRWSLERMRGLPIAGSEGAWGDVEKPCNVVNGYLVDVRRSAWDMLRCEGPVEPLPEVEADPIELRARVHRECQFPPGARSEAYQDFWIGGVLERGQRRIVERAETMGFCPKPGDTVLDIGCQAGGFLQYAQALGASRVAGVEIDPGYIDCARALAQSCGQNTCIREMNVVAQREDFLAWVRAFFPHGVDHLLLLSMEKHLGEEAMFLLADAIGARRTYVETNAVSDDAPMKLHGHVLRRGGQHVGDTTDRNLRRLYRIGVLS